MEPQANQSQPVESQPQQQPSPIKGNKTSNKKMTLLVTLVVCVVAAVGVIVYFVNPNGVFSPSNTTVDTPLVSITTNGFSPATIKIKKGQAVQWTNNSTRPRQLIGEGNNPLQYDTDAITTGNSYRMTFDTPGTYKYHDQTNPVAFTGTVVVEQ
ncbi:MAG TPA: cupredoxin domain-containing protein [Candidatus Saccharimonas sp.]|nr:cupredoxin domain-containing protein [Candidatus Saccharimonas sp.]